MSTCNSRWNELFVTRLQWPARLYCTITYLSTGILSPVISHVIRHVVPVVRKNLLRAGAHFDTDVETRQAEPLDNVHLAVSNSARMARTSGPATVRTHNKLISMEALKRAKYTFGSIASIRKILPVKLSVTPWYDKVAPSRRRFRFATFARAI